MTSTENMSLLSMVERAVKSYKAEQAKINDSIQLYREILHILTAQPKTDTEEPECKCNDFTAADRNTSAGEKEDIELLERVLEKALRVRTGSGVSQKDPSRNNWPGPRKETTPNSVPSKDITESSAPSKRSQITIRTTSKSEGLDRKRQKKPGSSTLRSGPSTCYNSRHPKTTNNNSIQNHPVSSAEVMHHQATRKFHQTGFTSAPFNQISVLHSIGSRVLSGSDPDKVSPISTSSNVTVTSLHKDKSGAHSLLQHSGTLCVQTAKWKSLMAKQNRLWDKVIALQTKPVSGRSRFMERMRSMFPRDWPCGSPDQIRVLVEKLTHQGRDLTQHWQTKELLAKHTHELPTELGGQENNYDSNVTAAELHNFGDQVKQEWEAWDQWRPEGGCLCPTGENGVWGVGMIAPLPLTLTYATEEELRRLEDLRMRVALLQQEIYVEQALLDTLSPLLSSIKPGPGCPKPSVLRDMYSLLCEGGERFPSLVFDSEPD